MKNAYEIIGTNQYVVDKIRTEDERYMFLLRKKKSKIEILTRKLNEKQEKLASIKDYRRELKLQEEIRDLESEIQLVDYAYSLIADYESREIYNASLSRLEQSNRTEDISGIVDIDNAYRVLSFSHDEGINVSDEEVLARKDKLIEQHEESIRLLKNRLEEAKKGNGSKRFREIESIKGNIALREYKIEQILSAYNQIATKEKRRAYQKRLKGLRENESSTARDQELKEKYQVPYKDNNLIRQVVWESFDNPNRENNQIEILREDGTKVTIEQIGRIAYRNFQNIMGEVTAYRIDRKLDGKEKRDICYSNLSFPDLYQDPTTGEFENEEYYQFVANAFLSDDNIDGSRFNKGYLGRVNREQDGSYYTDLTDIEQLTAVTKITEKYLGKDTGKEEYEK